MREWTKILTTPLGLAGFSLFLVFGLFAKIKHRDDRRRLIPISVAIGFVALIGGLILSYLQDKPTARDMAKPAGIPSSQSVQPQNSQVQQTSTGPASPNIQGIQGNVTLTINENSAKVQVQKSKKPPANVTAAQQ